MTSNKNTPVTDGEMRDDSPRAVPDTDGWRPIETTPEADVAVLLFFGRRAWTDMAGKPADFRPVRDHVERTEVGFWHSLTKTWCESGTAHDYFEGWREDDTPTHWMPLPEAPGTARHPKSLHPPSEPRTDQALEPSALVEVREALFAEIEKHVIHWLPRTVKGFRCQYDQDAVLRALAYAKEKAALPSAPSTEGVVKHINARLKQLDIQADADDHNGVYFSTARLLADELRQALSLLSRGAEGLRGRAVLRSSEGE